MSVTASQMSVNMGEIGTDRSVLSTLELEKLLYWTQTTQVISPSVRVAVFELVYTSASTCIYYANLKILNPKGQEL